MCEIAHDILSSKPGKLEWFYSSWDISVKASDTTMGEPRLCKALVRDLPE